MYGLGHGDAWTGDAAASPAVYVRRVVLVDQLHHQLVRRVVDVASRGPRMTLDTSLNLIFAVTFDVGVDIGLVARGGHYHEVADMKVEAVLLLAFTQSLMTL